MGTANEGKWGELLTEFHEIEKKGRPLTEKQKSALSALIDKAKSESSLTAHQLSGIVDRCNNTLNGTYGVKHGDYVYKAA